MKKRIEISTEPIELCKLLKLENLVSSGGEAKLVIAEGMVEVNGVVETRKGKKISCTDVVTFEGETYQVVVSTTPSTAD